jgi:dinuclear metal center YbgI/SA1388 family protein
MNVNELVVYLHEFYRVDLFKDYCPNGLQVEGETKQKIKKVALAVTASLETIEAAVAWGADTLITHHGIMWDYQGARPITGAYGARVRAIIDGKISLLSYHLPMDGHQEIGNAAGLAAALGIKTWTPLQDHKKNLLGVIAKFSKPLPPLDFQAKLEKALGRKVIGIIFDTKSAIQSVAIITGGAQSLWTLAKQNDCDAFITGEVTEYNYHDCRESHIHFFAGGHHATEVFGPKLLAEHLQQKLGKSVKVQFFNSNNPA